MKTINITEFRKNVSSYFDSVEEGDTLRIIRHGNVIAQISPLSTKKEELAWKSPGPRISVEGGALSDEILSERAEERKQ